MQDLMAVGIGLAGSMDSLVAFVESPRLGDGRQYTVMTAGVTFRFVLFLESHESRRRLSLRLFDSLPDESVALLPGVAFQASVGKHFPLPSAPHPAFIVIVGIDISQKRQVRIKTPQPVVLNRCHRQAGNECLQSSFS